MHPARLDIRLSEGAPDNIKREKKANERTKRKEDKNARHNMKIQAASITACRLDKG